MWRKLFNFAAAMSLVLGMATAHAASPGPSTTQAGRPAAPQGFFAYSTGASEVQLYWIYVDDPKLRHNIYRSTKPSFELSADNLIAREIETPYYHDNTVVLDTTYYYRVTAVRDGHESPPSREDSDRTFTPEKPATTSPSSRPAATKPRDP